MIFNVALSSAFIAAVAAAPRHAKRQDFIDVYETVDRVVATEWQTAWKTVPGQTKPTPVAQTQVIVNEVHAEYSYSSGGSIYAIPTVLSDTVTSVITANPTYASSVDNIVQAPAQTTITNSINPKVTPVGANAGVPLTTTLPLRSALIGGKTVTIPEATLTYYTPQVNSQGVTQSAQAVVTNDAVVPVASLTSSVLAEKGAVNAPAATSAAAVVPTTSAAAVLPAATTDAAPGAATSAAAVVPVASTTQAAATTPVSAPISLTSPVISNPVPLANANQGDFVFNLLQSINTVRAAHSAAALQWDGALAFDALNYAQTCTFDHSTAADYGETLAAGTSTDPAFYVSLWAGEEALYDYNKPGFSVATGHFTQLVWKATTSVGCGFSSGCGSSYPYYLVCRYKTAGNVLGGQGDVQYFTENVSRS